MWDFKTLLPPKHWQQLKASVIAVLFKEKKKKRRKKVRYSRWLLGLASAIVLLLIAPVQLSQLLLSHPPSLVGFGWAAGARGLGWLGAVAAWGRTLQEVVRYATLQVLHGRRGCHADDPGVLEGLTGGKSLTGIHCQNTLYKVFGKVGHTGPWLQREDRQGRKTEIKPTGWILPNFFIYFIEEVHCILGTTSRN